MAQRLATEYVKASLTLSEADMDELEKMLAKSGLVFQVKVFENGNHQLTFHDETGQDTILNFERRNDKYISEGSYRINTLPLANLMRKAVSVFKGDAIVNRIYSNFTMVYYYERGTVVKIVEMNEHYQKVIYEFKNSVRRLEQLFRQRQVEDEIMRIREEINALLDRRLHTRDEAGRREIDEQLTRLTYRLFVLEA